MPTDYINPTDGLLYCGKCNTRKQCKIPIFGRVDVQYCLCKCGQERLEKEKAEREQQQDIADRRRRECSERARSKRVDLALELSDGTRGHIQGSISSRKD